MKIVNSRTLANQRIFFMRNFLEPVVIYIREYEIAFLARKILVLLVLFVDGGFDEFT